MFLGIFLSTSLMAVEPYLLKEVDNPPTPVKQDEMEIPQDLVRYKGTVKIRIVIDETGNVSESSIHKSTVNEMNSFALQCVRRWKFKPAVKDGQSVPVAVVVPVRFK
jgi:protein TonB